MMWEETAVF